ncbi:MAG: FAD-dependent 5-carboxymethylaminomethyl-2-thiouridine(34) oxidoreductase MnmC [Neisseria sp.]|nr:FAD-dependent 5-carboxymethylaminomethyl-2-thiouridine(34) oxidoreductase MnmC [Neisseria sp.]
MAALAIIRAALAGKHYAALFSRHAPDEHLCAQIAAEFPHCAIDWIGCADAQTFQAAYHPALSTLNPRGISIYPLSARQRWWFFSPQNIHLLPQHFSPEHLHLIDGTLPEMSVPPQKPWFRLPESVPVSRVCIVGGGIAAAATAHALAQHGVAVTVLEAARIAGAASGNRQGLLYAQISPHDTVQSRLLLQAYGFALGTLRLGLPESDAWQQCGVLHLDHDAAATRRNRALVAQPCSLYRYLEREQASDCAGMELASGGLWWPHGAWIHPPALVRALLRHPLIDVREHTRIVQLQHNDHAWQLHAADGTVFSGSHVVLCSGAAQDLIRPLGIEPAVIRGQTDNARADAFSGSLKTALSGASYISPAWQNAHCFGATFQPHDEDTAIRAADSAENHAALARLNPQLSASLSREPLAAHAALRCDAYDHLPVVGALGDAAAMRQVYAKLAHDKNYRLEADCPYLPQLYVNTAHGSRGLLSAPLCGAAVAAEILGLPHPFDHALRAALSPNRLIIRNIIRF